MKTFLERVSLGEVCGDETESYVESWHDCDFDCSLVEFLEISEDEYALWVEKPSALDLIIRAHSEGMRQEKIG